MRVHFISIGGAVMHNLAIVLKNKGHHVTGSDDEIIEPSKSRLKKNGLLPGKWGWDPGLITSDIDMIILGMHARADNPELIKSQELGLRILSFPELLYELTKDKKRIVIGGSHGKTTITAMIMHVFRFTGLKFDYAVGSMVDGFENMAGLSDDSEIAVFEGDEYLSSAIDRRPKFHLYNPDIAVMNGIAWDHKNVFPTFENYVEQFRIFLDKVSVNGTLIYYEDDSEIRKLVSDIRSDIKKVPYKIHGHFQNKVGFFAATHNRTVQLEIFGEHNMQNLSAAREACIAAGVTEDDFYKAIKSFMGTAKRLQKIKENESGVVYLDFAHSPSKVKATVDAMAARYPDRDIIACLELHTYSSLSADFLPLYCGTLEKATSAFVYFNPHAIEMKKLSPLSKEDVTNAFGRPDLMVYDNSQALFSFIKSRKYSSPVYLLMSSGDFNGFDPGTLV
jgi:UDP-N-acetylmuramate: L-alanyl-gamma-D-glutamyl-meso-diaminopimelate ligase